MNLLKFKQYDLVQYAYLHQTKNLLISTLIKFEDQIISIKI